MAPQKVFGSETLRGRGMNRQRSSVRGQRSVDETRQRGTRGRGQGAIRDRVVPYVAEIAPLGAVAP